MIINFKNVRISAKTGATVLLVLFAAFSLSSCMSTGSGEGKVQKSKMNVSYQIKAPVISIVDGMISITANVYVEGKAKNSRDHQIKVYVKTDEKGFFIPLNSARTGMTSLQELGIPKEFDVRTYYFDDYETVTMDVNEDYRRIAMFAKQGKMNIKNDGRIGLLHLKIADKQSIKHIINTANKVIAKNLLAYSKSIEKPFLTKAESVPEIKKPKMPDAPTLNKDRFETKAEFQVRVQSALDQRNATIAQLQSDYRAQVERRNKKVEAITKSHQADIQAQIAQYNRRLQDNQQGLNDVRRTDTAQVFTKLMGVPYLEKVDYDAETSRIYANLRLSNSKQIQKISVEVPREQAKLMFHDPKNIKVDLSYQITASDAISLQSITLNYDKNLYVASITEQAFKAETMQVKINTNKLELGLKQIDVAEFSIDENDYLQNPNLVDQYQISAVTYVDNKEREVGKAEFNDDIPTLLKKSKGRKVSNKRWLFVVGIEDYQQTDNIRFAKRSAELFVKVAQKKLGISKRNTYALIDKGATVGAIKDKMQLMLNNVKKGDEIYFYYNGHGIPDVQHNNTPYILASDKIPDFVTDDDFFKLENIYQKFTDSNASKTVAFVDSCFSGATDGVAVIKGVAASRLQPKKVQFNHDNMVVLTAGSKKQYSNVYAEKGNRLFSYYLMKEILTSEKDINTIYSNVRKNVRAQSYKMGDLKIQEPSISGNKGLKI